MQSPVVILEPDRWIPRNGAGLDLLSFKAALAASDGRVFRENVRDIVEEIFLKPLIPRYRVRSLSYRATRLLATASAPNGDPSYTDYFRAFWNLANEISGNDGIDPELENLRTEAIAAAEAGEIVGCPLEPEEEASKKYTVTVHDVEACFPLPEVSTLDGLG